jgi:L-lactate dehydrogenase complex protein LldG
MSDEARDAILQAIRAATADVPAGEPAAWTPDEAPGAAPPAHGTSAQRAAASTAHPRVERHGDAPSASPPPDLATPAPVDRTSLLELAAERIADYRATVTRVPDRAGVADAIGAILRRHRARHVAIPADLAPELRPLRAQLYPDDPPLSNDQLGALDGVVTGCALAIAQTGTIVLDAGPGQGRRALTLLPDLHVCVIDAGDVVLTVPQAIERLGAVQRPITFISGPSATSDIELDRVEGVHGPRRLEVVLAG